MFYKSIARVPDEPHPRPSGRKMCRSPARERLRCEALRGCRGGDYQGQHSYCEVASVGWAWTGEMPADFILLASRALCRAAALRWMTPLAAA